MAKEKLKNIKDRRKENVYPTAAEKYLTEGSGTSFLKNAVFNSAEKDENIKTKEPDGKLKRN